MYFLGGYHNNSSSKFHHSMKNISHFMYPFFCHSHTLLLLYEAGLVHKANKCARGNASWPCGRSRQTEILSILRDDLKKYIYVSDGTGGSGIHLPKKGVLYDEEGVHFCFPTVVRWEWAKVHLSFITVTMCSASPGQGETDRGGEG